VTALDPARDRLAALLASRLAGTGEDIPASLPRRPDPDAPVPLTPIQRRLWFLWQLDPGGVAYHMPLVVRLRGPVDLAALCAAVVELVTRHEAVRGVVTTVDGEPAITVAPPSGVPVTTVDLSHDDAGASLDDLLAGAARRPFALDLEPPCRVLLARVADDHVVLALTLHHLASDGRSQDLLLRDLADLYAARLGLRRPPPAPRLQHGDVASWQARHRDEQLEAEQLEWWAGELAGLPPLLDLPTDRPRPDPPTWASGELPLVLPDQLTAAVRATAAATATTPFMVLMAALQALLARLARTDDVPVGMPEAGRRHRDTEDVVGCFLNTLVVRGDVAGDPTGRQLLHRVRDRVLGALAHADVPFQQIVERVHPDRSLGATPLYQVQLNVFDEPPLPRFPGLRVEADYTPAGAAKFDLNLALTDRGPGGGLVGSLEYRTELFDRATAQRWRDWYLTLLAGMLADLDQPVGAVPLEPVTGPVLRGPVRPSPLDGTLVAGFHRAADRDPDAVAVVGPDGQLSYRELERYANRIAHQLVATGVEPDQPVGVLLEPGTQLAAAILGVLTAGAGYLPIDATYPTGRVAQMLDLAGARVVVTTTDLASRVTGCRTLRLDDPAQLAGAPADRPGVAVTDRHLAHVIFTSGSTGTPKGVAVEHRGIVNCVTGMLEHAPELAGASYALVSTIAADLGLASFYGALLSGGTVHLLAREVATDPAAYRDHLARHRVDAVKCVPSHLTMLAAHHADLADLLPRRVLMLAGEAVSWELVHRVRAARPDLVIHTHYGPTESSMFSLICDVDRVPGPAPRTGFVPLGEVLPDIACHVLDPAGRPLPPGVPGELAITGPGVSRGYLGRPDLTEERFGPDPVGGTGPAARCYRTGDLVRVRPGSSIVDFLGRVDDQVKVRGYRVELGEVAAACRAAGGVRDAFVLAVGDGHDRHLVAWLAAPADLDTARVRARLRERMPDYQVPAALVLVDRLPLTVNGKVDRSALPPPEPDTTTRRVVAPRDRVEREVARAWQEVLGVEQVSVDDDFFALGGHSFAATRVVGRLRQRLGRDVPLRLLFEKPVLADLAADLTADPAADLAGTGGPHRSTGSIPRRDPADPATPAALSSAQARLWFLSQLEPDSPAYHIPLLLRLRGQLDADALAAAVRDLVARQEVLRSVVAERDGELTARPLPPESVTLATVETTPDDLAEVARERAERPFRLDREPPLRAVLYRLAEGDHALALTFHHIAMDGWSVDLALAELAAGYAARVRGTDPPEPPPVQYADYAAWLALPENEATAEAAVTWWLDRLGDAPPVLALPTDRPRPPVATPAGGAVPIELPAELTRRLREVAARAGATPFMVLLATWQAFLGRLADTTDVVVGVPVSGRHHPDVERLIGCFVNTLPLRTDLSGDPTGWALLERVRTGALAAFARAEAPFERMVERLAPDRDPSSTPVFQVLLNVLEDNADLPELPELAVDLLRRPEPASKYELNLGLVATGDSYSGKLAYRTDLFDAGTVRRWAGWYLAMLAEVVSDPDRPVSRITVGGTGAPLIEAPAPATPATEPPFRLIERTVDAYPDALAVVGADGDLTYRELDRRANQLAHALLAAGVRPQEPVGVLLEPSSQLVVALLGIQKAGACYLPFDASFPPRRVESMLATAGARTLLTSTDLADRAPAVAGDGDHRVSVIVLDAPSGPAGTLAGGPGHRPERPERPVSLTDLAHVVFTSGSTGVPKPVAVEHGHLADYLAGAMGRIGAEVSGGSFAMLSTPAADLGLTAIFAPLTTGGTAHLVDREVATDPTALAGYLARHRVDVLKCVPSHLELLAANGDLAGVLPRRLLILTGEALSWDLVGRVRAARPRLRVQNHYGHTETTLSSLICEVDEVPEHRRHGTVPLGRPLPGVAGFLVDRGGAPVPVGVPGELWLAGGGVARGYLGDERLTAERFGPDPVTGERRCYRSGDVLLVRDDGTVEYRGRVDDQVKIRGHRVEPGEVTAALRELPGVADAVVLPDGDGHQRTLVAWVVPAPGAGADPAGWRAALRERLPDHFVPSALVPLDRLPLSPNGKVDRAALPPPTAAPTDQTPPTTPTEIRIAEVWQQILAVPAVGRGDDFFALGGDSFSAVRAVRAIDPTLRVIDLFTHPVLADLAAYLDAKAGAGADGDGSAGLLHRLAGPTSGATLTLVCVPYGGGSAAAYRPVAERVAERSPGTAVLAVELPGHDPARPDEPLLPIDDLVDRLAAELAGTVTGPVALYGHCVGTAVAVALARRLEQDGREVAGVVLAGGFPTARLPGKLATLLHRAFGTDRWASTRSFRDTLRAMGGLLDDMDEASTETMLTSMRHDSRQAQEWYTRELVAPGRKLHAPALCLVGDRDRVTEFYQERYQEWGAFTDRVGLAVIPRAGHYFLKYQADRVAELVVDAIADWRRGQLPPPAAAVPVSGRPALKELRSFYLLAIGQLVALVGSALSSFALGFWAFQESGRASDYALVVMLALVPTALLSPLGGAVADRFDRRKVMLAAHLLSAQSMVALVVLLATDSLALWNVSLIVGLTSVATAFHQPAYLAAIAQLVPKPYLPQANALAQMGVSVSQLAAPLAGGALIALLGLAPVVVINVVTFVVGMATLLAVRLPDRMFRRAEESFRSSITGGWRFIVKRRPLVVMIGYFMVVNFFTAIMWVSIAPIVLPRSGPVALGVVTAIGWAGAVLGGLAIIPWGGTRRRTIGMVGFVIGSGAGMVLMGAHTSLAVIAIGLAIRLASMAVVNAHWLALIQVKVGHELQGRVLATNLMLALLMQPVGFLIAGPLADDVLGPLVSEGGALAGTVGQLIGVGPGRGMALLVLCAGVLLTAWGVLGLLYRPLRLLEDELPDAVPAAEIDKDLDLVQAEADQRLAEDRVRVTS
jgi:amino acid adenylation domain-containing protein